MQLLKFDNYDSYVHSQHQADRWKSKRVGFSPKEMESIVRRYRTLYDSDPQSILCHGVRYGQELDEFRRLCPNAAVHGTDLFRRNRDDITEWDFHQPNDAWLGQYNIVYSNSLDHAYDPGLCIKVWLEQLQSRGLLCVQWNSWDISTRGGDCFGGHLHEWIQLIDEISPVECLLWIGGRAAITIIVTRTCGSDPIQPISRVSLEWSVGSSAVAE